MKEARLERSGKVSVVKRGEARVVEVRVEDGVQVVRVEVVGGTGPRGDEPFFSAAR